MTDIASNIARIQERIARATERSGRRPGAVTLLAVTKTVSLDRVEEALAAGLHDVGENRVQEAVVKYSLYRGNAGEGAVAGEGQINPKFHLIGPLQSNKAKKAVGFFDVIQTLDRLDIARDVNRHAEAIGKKQVCLIEVKLSFEDSKSGCAPERLAEFLQQLKALPAIEVRGLMGIPPLAAAGGAARPYFQRLRRLFEDSQEPSPPSDSIGGPSSLKTADGSPLTCRGDDNMNGFTMLSMGMSSDFEVAIEEGSTMVRIGTALFGAR